jgi:hypothetical protein
MISHPKNRYELYDLLGRAGQDAWTWAWFLLMLHSGLRSSEVRCLHHADPQLPGFFKQPQRGQRLRRARRLIRVRRVGPPKAD